MANYPQFTNVPSIDIAQISIANTNRDGTGTIVTVATGSTNGKRINKIVVKATGSTTAGMVRLFIDNGTNVRLYKEIDVTGATPGGTVKAFSSELVISEGLILPNGYILKASTHNAETFNVIAEGGEF